eukprot:gene15983-18255_t
MGGRENGAAGLSSKANNSKGSPRTNSTQEASYFKTITITFEGIAPNPIHVGTVKRPRADSLSSTESYVSVLEQEVISIAATKLGTDPDHLKITSIVQQDSLNVIESVTGIVVGQMPGTLPVCPQCALLRTQLEESRDRALLRQAGANVINILKATMYRQMPLEVQKVFHATPFTDHVDWNRLEVMPLSALYNLLTAEGHVAFLKEVELESFQGVKELGQAAAMMKDLFNSEAHPVVHLDGSEATLESCEEALEYLDPEGEVTINLDKWELLYILKHV